ncbi:MAG: PHP domain-containing protein [Burkholderiales bacterium]|uniref:3',5'-nucleoside bisphosphate phosphatase n=1 Tax=Nitrosomonas sp. TaxID=42353 RepID=UPI001D65D1C6|nr:3',5'-nucleoside bisphosphate phosphatase [Nitrosomonas sp.]MCB1949232.1 PHP domain-containing protein [Nitrosomonas sp.]MCP5241937.1 PHP domain-containing protein [Burkholderiales bacterium]
MLDIDLHCHSNVSDGVLTPAQLINRAAQRGVVVLALTDHDDVAGLDEARLAALEKNITFINGVEISVSWRGRTIHILGLNIDPEYQPLFDGLLAIRTGRTQRAQNIAAELEKAGIAGSLEGAYAYVGERGLIGRTHFARFLVEKGYAKDMKSVFKKYLVKGKPGYTSHEWAALSEAIAWIIGSGGRAVIAHPARYNLGKNVLNDLLDEFSALGGSAIEVISASHTPQQMEIFAAHARNRGLLASCGSDFHGPGESFYDLGRLPELPTGCVPVWHDWNAFQNN